MNSVNLLVDPNSRMQAQTRRHWERREFVKSMTALAGAVGLSAYDMRSAAAEPPPETTSLRIFGGGAFTPCVAPLYVAQEQLLHSEGFTDVRYVEHTDENRLWPPEVLLSNDADISLSFPPADIKNIDAGASLVILAGSHTGCVQVVGGRRVRSTADLKGKTVVTMKLGADDYIFISMFAAYVGLNPKTDINWVTYPYADCARLLMEEKIDAFMCGPPVSLELREKKIGHVLVDTTTDKPWSHHFCCLVASSREFVRKHPVATKRALRAIVKAADICAAEPKRVARLMADRGFGRYESTLQLLQELPYGKWREYDPEDALRFYSLRMRELGMIKSKPQRIIAEGTDWRFLNELKRELKA